MDYFEICEQNVASAKKLYVIILLLNHRFNSSKQLLR